MTTTTVEKDEDLIILSDNASQDNSLLDFNFDFESENKSQSITTDSVIDFWESSKINEVSFDISKTIQTPTAWFQQEITASPNVSEISFWEDIFNFWWEEEWKINETTLHDSVWESKVTEKQNNNEVDFWLTQEGMIQKEESWVWENISLNSISDIWEEPKIETIQEWVQNVMLVWKQDSLNRNDILDEAISKMQKRKASILEISSSKQSEVDELNEQIKRLKKEVSQFEWEIKDLEKEDGALDSDIESIEKMKANISEVLVDRPRKHNLDNIKNK